MNKLILATGVDSNYYISERFLTYVNSIINNSNFDRNIIVLLDCQTEDSLIGNIEIAPIYSADVQAPNKNRCLQHGDFLNADIFNEVSSSDIIIFTDGDMDLQRNLTQEEESFLRNLKDGEIYVGYNESPEDTLEKESSRLGRLPYTSDQIKEDLSTITVYNTGVFAMNKKTWQDVLNIYVKIFPEVNKMFDHYAKQQWLLSYIIGTKGFKVYEMPYQFHTHSHYPPPPGTTMNSTRELYYNNEKVLFKHNF